MMLGYRVLLAGDKEEPPKDAEEHKIWQCAAGWNSRKLERVRPVVPVPSLLTEAIPPRYFFRWIIGIGFRRREAELRRRPCEAMIQRAAAAALGQNTPTCTWLRVHGSAQG